MIKINLLGEALSQSNQRKADKSEPQAEQVYTQEESVRRASLPIAGLLVGLVFASIGGLYYLYLNREFEKKERYKAELEVQQKELEKYTSLYQQYVQQKDELKKKYTAIKAIKDRQELPVKLMQELANCIPDDIWFKDIVFSENTLSMTGSGSTFEAVNIFRSRLTDNTKWFKNVTHQGSKKESAQAVNFMITLDVVDNPS